jgi:hypothetical protein
MSLARSGSTADVTSRPAYWGRTLSCIGSASCDLFERQAEREREREKYIYISSLVRVVTSMGPGAGALITQIKAA